MDVAFTLTRLTENVNALIEEGDFAGAEQSLVAALAEYPGYSAFLHLQIGRLYRRWNKLTSAIHHLHHAVEAAQAANENLILIQILDELNQAKNHQRSQRP